MLANKTILIIEDREYFRQLVTRILMKYQATVLEAADGQTGFAMLQQYKPDISICDIFMPVMNGHEFVNAAKHHPSTQDIPIIIITATEQKKEAVHAVQKGAEAYLLKPFSSAELLQKIALLLTLDIELPS